MPSIDPAWIIVAPMLLLFWRPMRERVVRSLPFSPLIRLQLEALLTPSRWLSPISMLKILGFLPIEKHDFSEQEAAERQYVVKWADTHLPNVGDWCARYNTFSDDNKDGWFTRKVRASMHDTAVRATHDRLVLVQVRTGHYTSVSRTVINLNTGFAHCLEYDTADEVRFDDTDTFGCHSQPEIFVSLSLSVLADGSDKCKDGACALCRRTRETLQKK